MEIEEKIEAAWGGTEMAVPVMAIKSVEAQFLQAKLGDHPFSMSALEEYGTCPFLYFCRRWLKIDPLGEPEIIPSRLTEGSVAHFVLKEFFQCHRGHVLRRDCLDSYLAEIRALVEAYYPQTDAAQSMLHHNLLVLGRENLISILTRVVQEEVEWGEKTAGRFTPCYFELGFGGLKHEADASSTPKPLVLAVEDASPDQPPLKIWGKIDRVDTDRAGNFIVYDYKTGNPPSQTESLSGKRPSFLVSAGSKPPFLGRRANGAAYYSLQNQPVTGIWRQEAQAFGIKSRNTAAEAWTGRWKVR